MSELPVGWSCATIGELCAISPRTFDEPLGDDDELSQVPMAAVEAATGRMDGSRVVRYGDVKRKSLTPFQNNDVLFAKVTPCMENGKIALATGLHGGRAVGSTELFALRSLGGIDPKYLMYFLLQTSVRKDAEHNMTGAVGLRRVPRPYLEALQLPLPPLTEQRRIIVALEEYLTRLNSGRHSISVATERSKHLTKLIVDSALSKLSEYPSLPLKDLLREPLRNGHSARATDGKSGVRTLTLTAVTKGQFVDAFTKITSAPPDRVKDLWLKSGDILIERSNTPDLVGTSALYSGPEMWAIFPDLLIRVRVIDSVLPEYVSLVLSGSGVTSFYRRSAKGLSGSMPKIDQGVIERTRIPVPPLEEQHRLISEITEQCAQVMRLKGVGNVMGIRSEQLHGAILTAAFSGRLVPQDPKDEPASLLLERVKRERASKRKPERGSRTLNKTAGIQGDLLS